MEQLFFQALATIFISQAYGVELGFQSLLTIVVTATLSAVGCAGIPGGAWSRYLSY